jgi:hypothetical protein
MYVRTVENSNFFEFSASEVQAITTHALFLNILEFTEVTHTPRPSLHIQ